MRSIASDLAYLNLNALVNDTASVSATNELPYIVQCRDFEDHIQND